MHNIHDFLLMAAIPVVTTIVVFIMIIVGFCKIRKLVREERSARQGELLVRFIAKWDGDQNVVPGRGVPFKVITNFEDCFNEN